MSWEWVGQNLDAVFLIAQAVIATGSILLHKAFASKEHVASVVKTVADDMKKVTDALDDELKRIAAAHTSTAGGLELLKKDMANLPTADDVAEIKLSISGIEGDYKAISVNVENMDKHITSIGRSVDRIEGYMMEGKKTA